MRIHLDTDLGGDPDDACALAMLLGWPEIEVVGITTTIDPGGRRAGHVASCLELLGRSDIPVAAGAELSLTTKRRADPYTDERFWPRAVAPRISATGAALDLLRKSIDQGATVVGIGPYTNLALLEQNQPGSLSGIPVVVMGGWVRPPSNDLPAWGPERDFNVQWDTRAAEIVARTAAQLTLVTLPATLKAHLRRAHLPRLRASGPLGELLARQSEAHAQETEMAQLARANAGLPADLLNFHYDPVTCAVALGWPGARVEEMRLRPSLDGNVLRFLADEAGELMRVAVDLDGPRFAETWVLAVESAQRS